MKNYYLFLFLTAPACGIPETWCKSTCGAYLTNPGQTAFGGCAEFQEAEDTAMKVYAEVVTDARFKDACAAVKGAEYTARQEDWWWLEGAGPVAGVTVCPGLRVEINNQPWYLGSYVHETAHVVQRCTGTEGEGNDPYHRNWDRDGIAASIDWAQFYALQKRK